MTAIFVLTTKTTQRRPQVFSVNTFDVIVSLNAKFFQIWSSVAGSVMNYACAFSQSELGK